jgi:hypothetical protein
MTDPVLAKLATVRRCLKRVRDVTRGDPARVRELDVQEIVVLNHIHYSPGRPRPSLVD